MAFDTQIVDLIGGTLDQTACDQWAADACKQIIHELSSPLIDKCVTVSTLNNSATTLDLDGIGKIMYVTRLSADSGGYQLECRAIQAKDSGRVEDSTDLMNYATADDPVWWIDSSSDVATLKVKPTPTANQTAKVYHVTYPTADVSAVSTIANFPDEAEYLVVLYVAVRQLLQHQSTMTSSFNSDITTAFTATNTELDETQAVCDLINTQADSAVTALSNMATEIALANAEVDLANPEVDLAKAEILESVTLIDGAIDTAATAINTAVDKVDAQIVLASAQFDLVNAEVDLAKTEVDSEDLELAGGYMQTSQGYSNAGRNYLSEAQAQLSEAGGYVQEINARIGQVNGQIAVANGYLATASGYNQVGQGYLRVAGSYGQQAQGYLAAATGYANEITQKMAIANAYLAEAAGRLAADNAKYQWYGDQYTKLQTEYSTGLAAMKSGT